jgi:hypothetical protein
MVMEPDDYMMERLAQDSTAFEVKAGGPLATMAGGMVRSTVGDKVDFSLALDGVMFERWAAHLTRATKPKGDFPGYAKRNWMLAGSGSPEDQKATLERYHESAVRHFIQWYRGDTDEDHAAATLFNINGYETLKAAMR